ncbi:HNH endonuclease signature motif containing protein [Actinomadura craniellae]|uniref:HNH endonuclease signature motif containing protein n=1 Tax=Actinomadura craniellae TaxID=2231787 RepID=UPI0011BF53AB|nr:DUF222 domain-containing protein [Actinomadura craniellae]
MASVDLSRLSGYDVVVVLRARARQVAHEQAELYAVMVEVADRVRAETAHLPGVWDSDLPKFAAAEIGAALSWTKRAAGAALEDAWLLVERLPAVWRALRKGSIDLPRAKVIVRETRALDEQAARQVATRILPEAAELTTGQLAYRIRRLALDIDPDAARKTYEQSVTERRVVHTANPDGTAHLAGHQLPPGAAAAAFERVDAIARAAKRAGDARVMDQIRTDVYLGLLNGSWDGPGPVHRRGVIELTADLPTLIGLADRAGELAGWGPVIADITRQIAHTAAQPAARDTAWTYSITDPLTGRLLHHGTTRRPQPRTTAGPASAPALGSAQGAAPNFAPGTAPDYTHGAAPGTASGATPRPTHNAAPDPMCGTAPDPTPNPALDPAPSSTPGPAPGAAPDPMCGTAPGPAPGAAPDPTPNPALDPAPSSTPGPAPGAAPDSMCGTTPDPTPGPAPGAVSDTTSGAALDPMCGTTPSPASGDGPWPGRTDLSEVRPISPTGPSGHVPRPERDPRRALTPRERAYVIARDRTCRGPGCRTSARRSEIDHIVPHAHGGSTSPDNTDAKCAYCHDLKDAGWTTTRTPGGVTFWTSPLGHAYAKPPEPITPPTALRSPVERRLLKVLDHFR